MLTVGGMRRLWDRLREYFGTPPRGHVAPRALAPLMTLRRLYLEQVVVVTNLEAAKESLERKISEHRLIAEVWDSRSRLPAPGDVIDAARRVSDRYWRFIDSEVDTLASADRALFRCRGVAEEMLSDLIRLGRDAARVGIDTRALAMEIDMGELEQDAREHIALSIIGDGGLEQDEDRLFLERLFERGLETAPAPE